MADLAVETLATVLPAQTDDQLKTLINDFLVDLGTTTQVVQLSGMNWIPSRVEKRGPGDREWTYEK